MLMLCVVAGAAPDFLPEALRAFCWIRARHFPSSSSLDLRRCSTNAYQGEDRGGNDEGCCCSLVITVLMPLLLCWGRESGSRNARGMNVPSPV